MTQGKSRYIHKLKGALHYVALLLHRSNRSFANHLLKRLCAFMRACVCLSLTLQALSHTTLHAQESYQEPYLDPHKPIDYDKLDLSYYPYIIAYNATTDEEIIKLVNNLEASEKKTGVFIGVYGGWIFHNATNNESYITSNAFAYGAKAGYQSFYPSLYDTLSIPNIVGGRIYLQYLGSNAKEFNYADVGFSGIGVSGDILVDLPVAKGLEAGAIMGLGLVSMTYDNKPDARLGGIINLGFDIVVATKHRTEAEIKFIINDRLDWFGAATMVGYSYVF